MTATRAARSKNVWTWVLLLLILADLAYTFFQHYHATLDGDMASIILPAPRYAQVLRDPLGFHAIFDAAYYGGPNRFIPHWTMERVYKLVPRALQVFATPLDSVYLTGALAKTAMQAALLYLLAAYASGGTRLFNRKLLLAALLITPIFQTYGLGWHIGIVSASPTYAFFYAAASVWLLLFFLPHAFWFLHGKRVMGSRLAVALSIPLAWATAFNGPLNSAVMLLLCPTLLAFEGWRAWRGRSSGEPSPRLAGGRPRWIVGASIAGLVFAAWSYVVGRFNIENLEQTLPLRDRYALLPAGVRDFFFSSPAVLVFTDALLINLALVNILRLPIARRVNRLALGYALFAVVFTILLPLGGYRPYRPLIIRWDSIQPVILGGLLLYAITGMQLLRHFGWQGRLYYGIVPAIVCVYFWYNDEPSRGNNYCEREALKAIAVSPQKVMRVQSDCTVMAWNKSGNPAESERAGALLHYWRIFPEEKQYYYPADSSGH